MIPVLGATLGGVLLRALQIFFVVKAVKVLAAFGLALGVYVGLDTFVQFAADQIQAAFSSVQSVSVYGVGIDVMGMIAATGVFEAINIMLSCHLTALSIKTAKVGLMGLKT